MKHYVSFMGEPINKCIRSQKGMHEFLRWLAYADQPSYGDILQFGYINRPNCVSIGGGEGVAYKVNCKGKTYILKAFNKCGKPSKEKINSFNSYCKEVQNISYQTGRIPQFYDWAVVNGDTRDNENLLILMQYINGRHLYKWPGEFADIAKEEMGKLGIDANKDYPKYKALLNAKELEICLQDYVNQNYKLADMSAGEIQRFLNACNLIYKLGTYSKLDLVIKNVMLEDDKLYLIDPYWQETPYRRSFSAISQDEFVIESACKLISPNNDLPNVVIRWLDNIDSSYLSSGQQKLLADLQSQFNKSLVAATVNVIKSATPMLAPITRRSKSIIKDKLDISVCTNNDDVAEDIANQLGLQ